MKTSNIIVSIHAAIEKAIACLQYDTEKEGTVRYLMHTNDKFECLRKIDTHLRIGLNDDVPFRTPSSAVRHAVTLVMLLDRSESLVKSTDDEH